MVCERAGETSQWLSLFASELLFALVSVKLFASAPEHNVFIRDKGVND